MMEAVHHTPCLVLVDRSRLPGARFLRHAPEPSGGSARA
jgi:hypothetical protein